MQKHIALHFGFGLAGMAALVVSGGCGGRSPSAIQPMEIASNAGAQAMAQLDANKDGFLDYNELAKAPGLRAGVASIKKMATFRGPKPSESQLQSAKISAEEIDARIQEWKEHGSGRTTVSCRVYRINKKGGKGKIPLAGAEVKFVPETFLGPGLLTGTGTTAASGTALVAQPSRGGGDPTTGMCPGFYRVEITKGNEIPAKYNTTTILGVEIAGDAPDLSAGGPTFDLEY